MLKQSAFFISTFLLAGPVLDARPVTSSGGGQQGQQPAAQQRPAAVQSVDERTSGMKKLDGYFPLYWDVRS